MKIINYRFEIDKKNNKKYHCPACGKKTFTRYISKATGKEAGELYGICSRKDNCNYVEYPKDIEENSFDFINELNRELKLQKIQKEPQFLSKSEYKAKLYHEFDQNHFVTYMNIHIGCKNADLAVNDYKLGTGSNFSCLFPYFDQHNNLVAYKTVFYGRNGKRRHDLNTNAYLDKNTNRHPIPLFGLQLINKYPDLPIGIVEGESTCAYMRYYNPSILWLAAGSATWLNASKLYPIRNRTIYLFPDVGQYENWYNIMNKIKDRYPVINIDISTECELWHEQGFIKKGEDIADYYKNAYKWSHKYQRIERQEIKPIK